MVLPSFVDISTYMPRWFKLLIFIVIIGLVSSVLNTVILAGKGSLVCDSNRDVYVLDDRPAYFSPFNFLLDDDERIRIQENDNVIRRIERKRVIEQGELNQLLITDISFNYKDPDEVGAFDCVKCAIGNDSDCRTQLGNVVKYDNMEVVDTVDGFWDSLGNMFNLHKRTVCSQAPMETTSERINITINIENRSILSVASDNLRWTGVLYDLDTSVELDEIIHANGDLYANVYQRQDGGELTSSAFPIRCTNNYDPEVTLFGVPLFNANFWILGILIIIMFKMLVDLKKIPK